MEEIRSMWGVIGKLKDKVNEDEKTFLAFKHEQESFRQNILIRLDELKRIIKTHSAKEKTTNEKDGEVFVKGLKVSIKDLWHRLPPTIHTLIYIALIIHGPKILQFLSDMLVGVKDIVFLYLHN